MANLAYINNHPKFPPFFDFGGGGIDIDVFKTNEFLVKYLTISKNDLQAKTTILIERAAAEGQFLAKPVVDYIFWDQGYLYEVEPHAQQILEAIKSLN